MPIGERLGITSAAEIDPSRGIVLGHLNLGPEAAQEAITIMNGGQFPAGLEIRPRSVSDCFFWQISRMGILLGEVYALPAGANGPFPTAIEVALVRSAHIATQPQWDAIIQGDSLVVIGDTKELAPFCDIAMIAKEPVCGTSALWKTHTRADLVSEDDKLITKQVLRCLQVSMAASPLKFRFLEIYRIMEAKFLSEVKERIDQRFFLEPSSSLEQALESLRSEVVQLAGLAERESIYFEAIYDEVARLRGRNDFADALFKKLEGRGHKFKSPRWKAGAALIYYVRCAVVHAGEKDMIFEAYNDGDAVLEAIVRPSEEAALALSGITLLP
ncbi:hypothetical protein [Mesorhizobium sp. M0870]|uniref:hypothetical protein n=1 Tax=Mesorhizobium sp. M0870 TaxID=2957016 RepID=UPI00333BCE34